MSLIKRFLLLALIAAMTTCGPEEPSTWMLGIYSDRYVRWYLAHQIAWVTRYEIRENGGFVISGESFCGDIIMEPQEYTWRSRSEFEIEVSLPDEDWRITQHSDDCHKIHIQSFRDGEAYGGPWSLWKGAVCLEKLPLEPCNGNCDSCITVWCDEEPPDCVTPP